MAAADVESRPQEPAPAVPDYLASPNAVFEDQGVQWRYGNAPDYSKTRSEWERTKTMSHEAGSLPQLVENLVKNWEVEASFKPRLEDWRTIDHANYTFAINGGPPQTAEHMLKVGTYNAIVAPNEYYSPEHSDFAASHKTFKRMMPTFAWEVLEVYSGPPRVAFRWRHWGEMKNDYVGFNNKGEKVTVKAHGGKIDIEGVTVAEVDDAVRLRRVETWFDPMAMFRQIAPKGIVNKEIISEQVPQSQPPEDIPVNDGIKIAEEHHSESSAHTEDVAPEVAIPKDISPSTGLPADQYVPNQGTSTLEEIHEPANPEDITLSTEQPTSTSVEADNTHAESHTPSENGAASDSSDKTWEKVEHPEESIPPTQQEMPKELELAVRSGRPEEIFKALEGDQPKDMEKDVQPAGGEAVAVAPNSEETRLTHEEMSKITPMECPFLMNRE